MNAKMGPAPPAASLVSRMTCEQRLRYLPVSNARDASKSSLAHPVKSTPNQYLISTDGGNPYIDGINASSFRNF